MTGDWRYVVAAAGIGVMATAIGVRVVWNDSPARGAADRAAVYASQTKPSLPGRSKPVEYAPKVGEVVPGDGTWIVGREIKRGKYATEGGLLCYWARLQGAPGGPWFAETAAVHHPGEQVVVLRKEDVAFSSQGCGKWVMVP